MVCGIYGLKRCTIKHKTRPFHLFGFIDYELLSETIINLILYKIYYQINSEEALTSPVEIT